MVVLVNGNLTHNNVLVGPRLSDALQHGVVIEDVA